MKSHNDTKNNCLTMTHTIHNKSYENKYQTKNNRYAHAMKALESLKATMNSWFET